MATSLNQPQAISQPFAQNGDKNIIPVTNDGTTGAASESLGFPQITSVPVAQGGIPPARKDFNGIFNVLSNQYFYLQNGGSFTFNQDVSDAIGGYPVNAILRYTDNDVSYQVRSLIPNNTYNFVTTPSYIDGVHWEKAFSEDLSNYVSKTGSNTISANNTFSGTNTFSGSTSLSTNTTGVTQAINDASTKIATTQFVQNVAVTKANKDMDNLTSTGQNIANWSSNVSNCITEIPQDIKLELNNGNLTLKAGSKVYVPNGVGVFNTVTIASDITRTQPTAGTYVLYLYRGQIPWSGTPYVTDVSLSRLVSGTTDSLAGTTWHAWYDTTNNLIKRYTTDGSSINGYGCLPLCIFTSSGGAISSIDQVFNGFGYIGHHIFCYPNVRYLSGNGFNEDGTLKSYYNTLNNVSITEMLSSSTTGDWFKAIIIRGNNNTIGESVFCRNVQHFSELLQQSERLQYVADDNMCYVYTSGEFSPQSRLFCIQYEYDGTTVTKFKIQQPFRAVDYNDFSDLKDTVDNTVKLTGDQTITNVKTFTDNIRLETSSIEKDIIFKNTTLDLTQSSRSSALYSFFRALDKNGNIGGSIGYSFSATGTSTAILQARNKVTGTLISGEIGINVDKNGTVYTLAPTPATSDNSTKIATTAYCNNKHQLVSALPASPSADVFYYIPEN